MHLNFQKRTFLRNSIMDDCHVSVEIEHLAELLKGKLYFAVTYSDKTEFIKNTADNFYFSTDDELSYLNYYCDFGPLNISCLYKYCLKLQSYLQCPQIHRIIHYTSSDPSKRVNAAYLIGSYSVIYLGFEPKFVYRKLLDSGGPFRQFVDASQGVSRYTIKLLECLQGIKKAMILNFFNFDDFNVIEYDLYDKIQNGDFNWLLPRKFLALIGPIDKEISANGHSPSFYVKYFLKNDIKTVIRLNNKLYDPYPFLKAGIDHYELFFPDGTTPPKQVLLKFLEIAENAPGAIAVHCKAGLGRTGSLIGAYIMKHYKFTAKEAIAWMRVCRPGSVIGQQQGWLEKIEPWLWKQGSIFRTEHYGEEDKILTHKYGIYSKGWQVQRKKLLALAHKRAFSESPQKLSSSLTSSSNDYDQYHAKQKERELQNLFYQMREREFLQKQEALRGKVSRRKSKSRGSEEVTQGDRLNEIKMKKYITTLIQPENSYKQYSYEPSEAYELENKYRLNSKRSKTKEKQYYNVGYEHQFDNSDLARNR